MIIDNNGIVKVDVITENAIQNTDGSFAIISATLFYHNNISNSIRLQNSLIPENEGVHSPKKPNPRPIL